MSKLSPLQTFHVNYDQQGKDAALSAAATVQLRLRSINAMNRSGAAIDVALLVRRGNGSYSFAQIDASATPDKLANTADADLKAGTATAIATTTNNDGYLIESNEPFNLVGFNLSTNGVAGTYTFEYFNGTAYTALTNIIQTPDYLASATSLLMFNAPHDWVVGSTAAVSTDSTSKFTLLVRGTTAPTTAPVADDIWVGKTLVFQEALADNGTVSFEYVGDVSDLLLEGSDELMPYFATANAANLVFGTYRISD